MQLFNLGSNSSLTNSQKVQNLWFLSKKLQNFLFHPHLCFGTKEYKRFSTVKSMLIRYESFKQAKSVQLEQPSEIDAGIIDDYHKTV